MLEKALDDVLNDGSAAEGLELLGDVAAEAGPGSGGGNHYKDSHVHFRSRRKLRIEN
jgi:hypothetical protein